MKKIFLGLSILFLSILLTILILSKNKHISYEEYLYSIPRIDTYHSTKEERMTFEVFINSKNHLISFVDKNQYYIVHNSNLYLLNHVTVKSEEDSPFQNDIYYKYTIECDLLGKSEENIILKNYELLIENEIGDYCFPMGELIIYNQEYVPLEFHDLYGNYAYINDELHLIGITIELDPIYTVLEQVSLGSVFGVLEKIEEDTLRDSECLAASLNHQVIASETKENNYFLTAKENYYYIPISYPELYLITGGSFIFQMDEISYSLEKFTYLANEIHLNQYQTSKQEGKIQYA